MVKYEYKLQIQLVSEGDKSEVACNGRPGRALQDPPGIPVPSLNRQEYTCTHNIAFILIYRVHFLTGPSKIFLSVRLHSTSH